jgi:hypothetical protein
MLVDILLLLVLIPSSFILNALAHELGHALAGKLVGLTIHRIAIVTDLRKVPVKPLFTLAGTEFYLAANSLVSYVTTSGIAFSQHPIKQIVFNLAGPISGASMATVFAVCAITLTKTTAVNVIALCLSVFYIVMDLVNLKPELQAYNTPSDGWKVREAWRQLRSKKQG